MIECQLFVACLLGSVKLAPMEVAKLINQCDVVVYALPTKNPYRVKIGQVLLAKKPIFDPEINLNSPRPRGAW